MAQIAVQTVGRRESAACGFYRRQIHGLQTVPERNADLSTTCEIVYPSNYERLFLGWFSITIGRGLLEDSWD